MCQKSGLKGGCRNEGVKNELYLVGPALNALAVSMSLRTSVRLGFRLPAEQEQHEIGVQITSPIQSDGLNTSEFSARMAPSRAVGISK